MKIVTLTSDDHHHRCLVSLLASEFSLQGAVIEPGREQIRRPWRHGRWCDYSWNIYHRCRRYALGLDRYRREYFETRTPSRHGRTFPQLVVPWINDPVVADAIRTWKPDITVVCCTSILKAPTLEACGPNVLNVHGGHLPDYRGNHCFFWALYYGTYDKIGSTVHFVDRGIDTGDIVAVVTPPVRPDDNAERLYCRAEWLAFQRLMTLLRGLDRGEALPRHPQPSGGRTFRTRDRRPWHDLSFAFRRWIGLVSVPTLTGNCPSCLPPKGSGLTAS